jgi:hypothetical protein
LIPNMRGTVGALQRALSREIYDIHVPLSAVDLARAHTEAGLSLQSTGYFLPAHYGVCNPHVRLGASGASARLRAFAYLGAIASSTLLLWIHEHLMRLPATELMSPYAFVLATKPCDESAAVHAARSPSAS